MLSDIRVLELSTPGTMLAGQILGDLGADVVTIEPPGGARGRRLAPFIAGRPGLERSLTWHALNRNKRGITLDVGTPDGREIVAALLEQCDVLIESMDEGFCLDGVRPPERVVWCEISSFSRRGPKSAYQATDTVLMAAGGAPALAGEPDRPPLFFPVPQAIMESGAEAAVAVLAGLTARDRLGVGQCVAVEARVATMLASLGRVCRARSGEAPGGRLAPPSPGAPPLAPGMYACADGWVTVTVAFLPAFVAMTHRIAEWLAEEGALSPALAKSDWLSIASSAARGEGSAEPIARLVEALTQACRRRTKAELVEISKRHRFMAAPAMDMADIAGFDHYRARGLFAPQDVGGHAIETPARFAQFSNYQIEVRRAAPTLSQHTPEILQTFAGLNDLELQALFTQGVI
jgi:benzylsuccinate CoA-transferase BbsE subunit